MKNILIAVSGTGGHVYPGIALAYELQKEGYNPIFIVNNNKNGVSLKIVKNSGYEYKVLDFKAPPRKISFLIGLDVYIALFSLKYFSVPLKLKAILFTNLDNILFASPGTEFCSWINVGILFIFAAKSIGKDKYAPIPITIFGAVCFIIELASNKTF